VVGGGGICDAILGSILARTIDYLDALLADKYTGTSAFA